ncbi:hypothetical protein [Rosenbergiella epipactidis]|uniref:hypothetical protein n=1 Tax=Rosenbergiella epipactidis TaxID=1544694 RepID=UPI001F4DB6CD|nr:hypothetical protein [Rosenbergiella epipactidis]
MVHLAPVCCADVEKSLNVKVLPAEGPSMIFIEYNVPLPGTTLADGIFSDPEAS